MEIDITDDEFDELASWMETYVEVNIAPGVDESDIDIGLLDPARVRGLSEGDLDTLDTADTFQLSSVIGSWRRWQDDPDRFGEPPIYTANLGTSPWRERRYENPPTVPTGRPDLVWMEWEVMGQGQFHRAVPDTDAIPVVGGAKHAVLTTKSRARDLGTYACPDCFPDEDGNHVSITDTETGQRMTVNTTALDELDEGAIEAFRNEVGRVQDVVDSNDSEE